MTNLDLLPTLSLTSMTEKITSTKFIPTLKIGYQIKAVETLVFLT
jgi:hypothetical protein